MFLCLICYTAFSVTYLKAEVIYLKCLLVKESEPYFTKEPNSPKVFEFISIDPENNYAETTGIGFEGKIEKSSDVHPQTKLEGKYFIWGKSWLSGLSENITFYYFYEIDLEMLNKKGKSTTRYVSNFTLEIKDGVKERHNELECKKEKNVNN